MGTGFKLRAPNSSARAGFSVSTVRRSIMLVRDTNFFQKAESQFRILGGLHSFGHGGGKPEGKEGGIKITRETNSLFEASPSTTNSLPECV